MKVTNLKKDKQITLRINSNLKEKLSKIGKTPQIILDNYLDRHFIIDKDLNLKQRR